MTPKRAGALWLAAALALICVSIVLTRLSARFGYDWDVIDMPITTLTALLLTAGLIYFAVAYSAVQWQRWQFPTPFESKPTAVAIMIACGLLARLILFASEPALEDDYQRYLWDGAVTAHGYNPYKRAPQDVLSKSVPKPLSALAVQSGPTVERINHKQLTTIYPPVAQGAFALAYFLKPFSLVSWRSVLLLADITTLALLFLLLSHLNRSALWAGIYWLNPIVLKEFFNSAHMDALILPLVLAALLLAIKKKPLAATFATGLAIGTKIWPVLLLPLIWRYAVSRTAQLIGCMLVIGVMVALLAAPYMFAGASETSGTLAYAERWTINAPLFTSLRAGLTSLWAAMIDPQTAAHWGSVIARAVMAGVVCLIALWQARPPIKDADDLITRALVIIAALIVLSPAIYAWYTLWMLPLLALKPVLGLLLLSATIPLYYTYFYFAARGSTELFQYGVTWAIWLPVWIACALQWLRSRTLKQPAGLKNA